jgi:hypothetical protein
MINFAIHLHAYWASHLVLLELHFVALALLLAVWSQISKKSNKAQPAVIRAKESTIRHAAEPLLVA